MSTESRGTGPAVSSPDIAFTELRNRMQGPLVLPGDRGYDSARRIFNAMIDRRPAAIAQCAGTPDVVASVGFARQHGIPISVRSGGHGIAGESVIEDGLMIDLSSMKRIEVDTERRIARAQAGLRLGEFIEATERYGLVSPTGTASDTGMAGLTLGAGFGWLAGHFGLATDNVAGAEIVLADGSVVRASNREHEDLYWAIRGGSGNFGIVTEFEMRLHPLTQVLGGLLVHPMTRATEVLQFYREISSTLPDELTIYAALVTGPDGNKAVGLIVCWSGDPEEGERVLTPIRAFGPPLADTIQAMPYSAMNRLLEQSSPPGQRNYWKQAYFLTLEDELIETITDFAAAAPSPFSAAVIFEIHGAATRVPPKATAFPHRDARYGLMMMSVWSDPAEDDVNIRWARELANATR